MELCPQFGRSLRGQVDEIERKIVPFGESMKDGGGEFIAGKFRIENYDAFSGQSALPEHHRCRDTFAGAGCADNLGMSFSDALPGRIDRLIVPVNIQTYKEALFEIEKLPGIVWREFVNVFHGLADIG